MMHTRIISYVMPRTINDIIVSGQERYNLVRSGTIQTETYYSLDTQSRILSIVNCCDGSWLQ